MVTLYGIKNCDTVKKARKWLDAHGIAYRYHDFRDDGLEKSALQAWIKELGWETVINRRSTSWRALDATVRDTMNDQSAAATALSQPTLVKRPLLDTGKQYHTGFSPAGYEKIFELHTL
ncbi:MAG: ArsC family reductase [Halieaceae bacterium]|nr:ArsC family reductase [Halieaceae bacterium]